MSGGFFRGTSADQDTRFSNKQAKLLKSQKFAPELEHLVDMTKVEMDIMRPWIANRVTELLGFEDEVLINFIYGLLEGKVVNGKEIQISLTGFMEKNTGKFMKELWTLLLSAQNNASRVPQQFLDAKEEETRNKKMEADRIKNEMLRIKENEGRELEQEKVDKMDDKVDNSSRTNNDVSVPTLRHQPRDSSMRLATDEKQMNGRNGSRGRTRVSRSPDSDQHSPSFPRGSLSRSNSKSFSNSRSHSEERHKSRSISGSSQKRGRSLSSEKMRRSPLCRSTTPCRRDSPQRSFSPTRPRISQFRQRSMSHSRCRSPSPIGRRLRSPMRRRSRSPMRRRSRTPVRRRSRTPVRRRSRTPVRRRSRTPVRRRLRTPVRRRSRTPLRRRSRSPLRYRSRSPIRRRSRSPLSRRSPSPKRRRSPSPLRRRYRRSPSSPRRRSPSPYRCRPTIPSRRSPTPPGRRSSSFQELSSQSPIHQVSPSPVKRRSPKCERSPVQSPSDQIRSPEQYFPVHHPPSQENIERQIETHKVSSLERRPPMSTLRSPQRDSSGQDISRQKVPSLSPSPYNSLSGSESPLASRKRSISEDRRLSSPYESPRRQTREQMIQNSRLSPPRKPIVHKLNRESPQEEKTKVSRVGEDLKFKFSGKKLTQPSTSVELKLDQQKKSEPKSRKVPQSEVSKQLSPTIYKSTLPSEGLLESYSGEGHRADEKSQYRPNHVKGCGRNESETLSKMSRKVEEPNNRCGSVDSDSEVSDKHRAEVNEKRKHKRSKRPESDDDSYDSKLEGRKEAKRRKKEEKRLRKEERRRRREERRRRKEERRAEKIKLKSVDTVLPPSDLEKNHGSYTSDCERVARREADSSDIEEAESEQKKLEIALRKKALESLRAKRGAGH